MLVAGVDSSTQSTKVEIRNTETGELVGTGRAAHPPTDPPRSEQDPRSWWDALLAAWGQASEAAGEDRRTIEAVAVAGQQHGLVVLDATGEPVRPAKLWNDTESAPHAAALVTALGAEQWAERAGSVPTASFTITKLAWLAANEPEAIDRIGAVMLPHDYLTWRLTGERVTDRGDASGTGWWSPITGRYDSELLAAVDLGDRRIEAALPRVLAHDRAVGTILGAVASQLGVGPDVLVGPGTGDNMAGALGLGLHPGDVAISIGTSGTVFGVSTTPTADVSGLVAGFADATGNYLPLVCTLNATKVTDAIGRLLGLDPAALADAALGADPGAGGVTLIPYFDGERTPNLPDSSGTIGGLRSGTGPAEIARAAHEGVTCGLLAGLDALVEAGVSVTGRRFLIGGGARSAAYRRVMADLGGHPIVVPDADETVATGACVQAAAIAGGVEPIEIAQRWHLGVGNEIEPRSIDRDPIRARYDSLATRVNPR